KEVNLVADPHGVDVIRVGAGDFFGCKVRQINCPEVTRFAASVAFPGDEALRRAAELPAVQRRVYHTLAVRGKGSGERHRQRSRRLRTTAARDGPELRIAGRYAFAVGPEKNALAVERPAHCVVGTGMMRDSLRDAAGRRYGIHVDVAVVFARESDRASVRRE